MGREKIKRRGSDKGEVRRLNRKESEKGVDKMEGEKEMEKRKGKGKSRARRRRREERMEKK